MRTRRAGKKSEARGFEGVNVTTSGADPAQESGDGAASEGQLLSDEDDLQAALLGLSRLVAGSDPLEALLTRVAEFAVHAIPGADGAGVTMYNDGTSSTVAASVPFVRDVDDLSTALVRDPASVLPRRGAPFGPAPWEATNSGRASARGWDGWACTAPCRFPCSWLTR